MRKQKRDPAHRAFLRGYQAGYDMKTKSLCPFQTETNTGQDMQCLGNHGLVEWMGC